MPKLHTIKTHELLRALKRAGFAENRQKGSHLHLIRPSDGRRVTVPIHHGRDVRPGTLRGILRDADLTPDEFLELL